MFRTDHFDCRELYETDKVICFSIFVNPEINHRSNVFLTQIVVSKKTRQFLFSPFSFKVGGKSFSKDEIIKEIRTDLHKYFDLREDLDIL